MASKRTGKRRAPAKTRGKKLGVTGRSVRDLPAGDRRSPSVKGGVRKTWTSGNTQPQRD
jgi:hypothetical protein